MRDMDHLPQIDNLRIYRLQEIDAEQYREVSQLWLETGVGNPARGDSIQVVKATLAQGAVILIARMGRDAVGTLWITHDYRRAYIHHMAVKPEFQNLGIGRKLMKEAKLIASELGLQSKLEVHTDNPAAKKIYSEAGFIVLEGYLTMIKRDI